ncbi:MAG: hypothetical protein NUV77_08035 [Thermoguttaceae bacterium]|jgi:hypothetical protein|nr:hypothetical protein [Thermoguttaceae bacterium]
MSQHGKILRRFLVAGSTWFATLFLLQVSAFAGFTVSLYAPSVYQANTSAMDAVLGVTGYVIEDFEDKTLVAGLSYSITPISGSAQVFSSLPKTYAAPDFSWDQTNVLVSHPQNAFVEYGVESITFTIAGGATSFGVGLANFQSLGSPSYPITDHYIIVNGQSLGKLDAFDNWTKSWYRNGYLRIDAYGGDVISTVRFENIAPYGPYGQYGDLMVFDHLALKPVPEPGALVAAMGVALILCIRGTVARIRKDVAANVGARF